MPKVEASFVDELKKTLRDGFTQAEVTEAKRAYADARKVSRSQETALVTLIASHEQLTRTVVFDEQQETKIQALTLEQVNAASARSRARRRAASHDRPYTRPGRMGAHSTGIGGLRRKRLAVRQTTRDASALLAAKALEVSTSRLGRRASTGW